MEKEKTLMSWAKEELQQIETERRRKMEERGLLPFYRWRKGENYFDINPNVPMREIDSEYGKLVIFRIIDEANTELELAVNKRSPLYAILVRGIAKGQTHFQILKSGEGKNTKYEELTEPHF